MEQQVYEAALAMVQPMTDPATRRQASQFLESWTLTPESWVVYCSWLRTYREGVVIKHVTSQSNDQIALMLLCLTMLQSKVRKEVRINQPTSWNQHVTIIRSELWNYLQLPGLDKSLIGPACHCTAALIVRCGEVSQFISHIMPISPDGMNNVASNGIHNNTSPSSTNTSRLDDVTALRLLACIPSEMELTQGLSPSQVTGELIRHLESVLIIIQRGLTNNSSSSSSILPACQALKVWAEISHVSLTQLNTPLSSGGTPPVLPTIVSILSSQDGIIDDSTLQIASQALTGAILVPTDHCTPTREVAAAAIWQSIEHQGFIVNPLQLSMQNEWHDASHALASLLSTFVTEQVEDIVAQPAGRGLQVLLDLQRHPHTPVALIPLDCWLAIQDVDMADRHEHWKRPLYRQLLPILVERIKYPHSFVNWEEELDVDESEFQELRRLVTDVLASCYYLLRVEMIQLLSQQIQIATDWASSEAALWTLSQISKDVCVRCKSAAPSGTMVAQDKQATNVELLRLLEQLMMNVPIGGGRTNHPVLLSAVINFCGVYSLAWNSMNCQPQVILQLLDYLQMAFSQFPVDAAKATRAIYVTCLAKNIPSLDTIQAIANGEDGEQVPSSNSSMLPLILKSIRLSMEAVLQTSEEEAMVTLAEGATRLITKLKDPETARQGLTMNLIQPVLIQVNAAVQNLPQPVAAVDSNNVDWTQPAVQQAADALARYLSVIQVIVRFCDAPQLPAMGEWVLELVGPSLDVVQQRTLGSPIQSIIFPKWLSIHQQVIRNAMAEQTMMVAIFSNTVPIVVQALEQTLDHTTLKYVATAVENFGGKSSEMDNSFRDLLSHVTTVVTRQSNLSQLTELLQAYFECLQRYLCFCTRSLCYNEHFKTITALSVESTQALQAKESTRACLNYLSQFMKLATLSSSQLYPEASQVLQEAWNPVILSLLSSQGPKLVQNCVTGLSGGSQMLWPAYSDCLFSLIQSIVLNQSLQQQTSENVSTGVLVGERTVEQWLVSSLSAEFVSTSSAGETSSQINGRIQLETCQQVTSILLRLASTGPKSRPKAKLLLFCIVYSCH